MSGDDALVKAIEDMVLPGEDDVSQENASGDGDLPKFDDKSILVKEKEEAITDFLNFDFVLRSLDNLEEEEEEGGLEGLVPKDIDEADKNKNFPPEDNLNEFYKARDSAGDLYDAKTYDEKNDFEDYIVKTEVAEYAEEVRPGERSMLEVAGFVDSEAEKKRERDRLDKLRN